MAGPMYPRYLSVIIFAAIDHIMGSIGVVFANVRASFIVRKKKRGVPSLVNRKKKNEANFVRFLPI
jgi:hypothetical protein